LVDGAVYQAGLWSDPGRTAYYVDLDWDLVLPIVDRLPIDELAAQVPGHHWNSVLASGQQLVAPGDEQLEAVWAAHVASVRRRASDWDVPLGELLSRRLRSSRYGGALYGGIEPSQTTPNVFLYTDPRRGVAYGYNFDGWSEDGSVFLYTGEGRQGNQQLTHGNAALLNHRAQGRALRLFVADGREPGSSSVLQRYVGEFEISRSNPYVTTEAADETGIERSVFVFRLEPVGDVLRRPDDVSTFGDVAIEAEATRVPVAAAVPSPGSADAVPLEALRKSRYVVSASPGTVATRVEAELVARFEEYLVGLGSECGRFKVKPPGEIRVLYTDLYDSTMNVLYEAKGTASRDAVRMALGQLLDYSRHIEAEPSLVVLLPTKPHDDLLDLLARHGVGCYYEERPGVFTLAQPAGA
jgi:5-methylcytosine-specific restriction protein A